jgi:hypothetical protein
VFRQMGRDFGRDMPFSGRHLANHCVPCMFDSLRVQVPYPT